jgi:hypothetical protein
VLALQFFDNSVRVVVGAIVDNNYLDIGVGLIDDRLDPLANVLAVIV